MLCDHFIFKDSLHNDHAILIFFIQQIHFHPAGETHIDRNKCLFPWLGNLGDSKDSGSVNGRS